MSMTRVFSYTKSIPEIEDAVVEAVSTLETFGDVANRIDMHQSAFRKTRNRESSDRSHKAVETMIGKIEVLFGKRVK